MGCTQFKKFTHTGFTLGPDGENKKESMSSKFYNYLLEARTWESKIDGECGKDNFVTCARVSTSKLSIGLSSDGDSGNMYLYKC